MLKKSLSSMEVTALVNELQPLARGKLTQIYHLPGNEFLFQFHVPTRGKQLVRIIPGKFFCLVGGKEVPVKPSGFCMQLRKYIENASIMKFFQKDSERIIVFELQKEQKYFLIIELFSKGNVVLTDHEYKIITCLEPQLWKERTVKPGEVYLFPSSGVNWKDLPERKLYYLLTKSEKRNVATSLATDLGLGGLYAEELCRRAMIRKEMLPTALTEEEVKRVYHELGAMISLLEKPQGYVYQNQITPFWLTTEEKPVHIYKTYNEAIALLEPFEKISPYEKRIQTLHRMIQEQEESLQRLGEGIRTNTQKAELLYEHYSSLQRLLEIVKELRKQKEWKEIAEELKKERKIKMIDLKTKKIAIDLL